MTIFQWILYDLWVKEKTKYMQERCYICREDKKLCQAPSVSAIPGRIEILFKEPYTLENLHAAVVVIATLNKEKDVENCAIRCAVLENKKTILEEVAA